MTYPRGMPRTFIAAAIALSLFPLAIACDDAPAVEPAEEQDLDFCETTEASFCAWLDTRALELDIKDIYRVDVMVAKCPTAEPAFACWELGNYCSQLVGAGCDDLISECECVAEKFRAVAPHVPAVPPSFLSDPCETCGGECVVVDGGAYCAHQCDDAGGCPIDSCGTPGSLECKAGLCLQPCDVAGGCPDGLVCVEMICYVPTAP